MPVTDEATETLALDSWHRARGARMVPFAGYAMPIQYDGIVAEHLWTRAHAGLFDVSHMGQLLLSGEGVAAALERLVPGNIAGLASGRVLYSLLLDDAGGILDDLMITNAAPDLYLVVNGATKWDDIAHLREHLPDEVTLNHLDDRALLAVQGPQAVAAAARVVPGVDALFFMESARFQGHFGELWISRSGYTGEDGVEISVDAAHADALADALCAQPEVAPIGLGARDTLRLEAGLPLYGHDLSTGIDPVAAGLGFAIAKRRREHADYPGAAILQNRLIEGPATKRVGFRLDGRLPAREGAEVFAGAVHVGRITSGGFSPSLQVPIAMGYVAAAHAAPGTDLDIDVRGKRLPATIVELPFFAHRYHRKGSA